LSHSFAKLAITIHPRIRENLPHLEEDDDGDLFQHPADGTLPDCGVLSASDGDQVSHILLG
jgi:hypothetical protein